VCAPDGTLFLEGLVTTPSAYLEKGNPVIYSNRQGDILLAGPEASRRIKEACVLIGGQTNHFHWTWEGVARMMQLERPELVGLPIVIPAGLASFHVVVVFEFITWIPGPDRSRASLDASPRLYFAWQLAARDFAAFALSSAALGCCEAPAGTSRLEF